MPMPVMNVRKMGMRMRQRRVFMGVYMRLRAVPFEVMFMLMVSIVTVRMGVPHPLMMMLMFMSLRHVQPDAGRHQRCSNPK